MDDDPDKPMAIYVKRNSRRKSVPVRIDGIGKLSLAEALLLLDNRHEGCQIKPEFSIAISCKNQISCFVLFLFVILDDNFCLAYSIFFFSFLFQPCLELKMSKSLVI